MRTRILLVICCMASLIFIVGCASITGTPTLPLGAIYTGTTGPVSIAIGNYPEYRIVGPAEGKSSAVGVLGIIAVGGASANEAYQDAIKRVQADALVDVRVDQKITSVLWLFSKHTTIVNGTAIKFAK